MYHLNGGQFTLFYPSYEEEDICGLGMIALYFLFDNLINSLVMIALYGIVLANAAEY